MKSKIRNPKSEARNKFKILISECSKQFSNSNFGFKGVKNAKENQSHCHCGK